MFTESVEDWLMISLDDDFFNQHRVVDILHTLHITVYMMRPVTYSPLSARSDDENYDVRTILHQGCRESIFRFLIETIVCIIIQKETSTQILYTILNRI